MQRINLWIALVLVALFLAGGIWKLSHPAGPVPAAPSEPKLGEALRIEVAAHPLMVLISQGFDGTIHYRLSANTVNAGQPDSPRKVGTLSEQEVRELIEYLRREQLVGGIDDFPKPWQPFVTVRWGDINSRKFAPQPRLVEVFSRAPSIGPEVKQAIELGQQQQREFDENWGR